MLLNPGVEVKAVECDTVATNRDYGYVRAYVSFEDGPSHPAVVRRVTRANKPWRNHGTLGTRNLSALFWKERSILGKCAPSFPGTRSGSRVVLV